MVKFTDDPNPTYDPNYTNTSRTPSHWEVSMGEDKSGGALAGGLAKLTDSAPKAAYDVINQNLTNDAYAQIDAIRGQHGSDLSPDQIPAIAGVGSRGAKFAAAGGVTDDQFGMDAVPPEIAKNVSGLAQMKDARDQGKLSDSYYDSQLEAVVKGLQVKYPGFREEIDGAVSKITGITPANALRRSVLNDMNSASAAANAANNKLQTRFWSVEKYMPGVTFDQYRANAPQYDVEVGKQEAFEHSLQVQDLQLKNLSATDARAGVIAEQGFTGKINQFLSVGIGPVLRNLQQEGTVLAAKGANATPQELAAFSAKLTAIKLQASSTFDQMARQPLGADGYTDTGQEIPSDKSYSTYLKPEQLAAIKKQGLSQLDTIGSAVMAKDYTTAGSAAEIMKMQTDQDYLRLTAIVPQVRTLAAIRHGIGDQSTSTVIQMNNGAIYEPLTRAITNTHLLDVANPDSSAQPTPVTDILTAAAGSNPVNPGRVNRTTVQALQVYAQDKDPKVAFRAVQSLYGDPKFFADLPVSQREKVFNALASPQFSQKMKQLGEQNPIAYQVYSNWVEGNFGTVAKQGIDDLQSQATYKQYQWEQNPKTGQFSIYDAASPGPRTGPQFNDAQDGVAKINRSISTVMPVLQDKYGPGALEHLNRMIRDNGFNPSAPRSGGFWQDIGKAISDHLPGVPEGEEAPARAPDARRGQKQSFNMEDGGSGPLAPGQVPQYIHDAAVKAGISPRIALQVARSEGLYSYNGDENTSFGPYQLHYGNTTAAVKGNRVAGLGDRFTKDTGLDARDPNTIREQIDYALKTASKEGWGAWHGWKGDQWAGINRG